MVLVNVSQAVHLQLKFDVAESHCGPNLFRRISSPMKHIVGRICNATCRANEGPGSLGCGYMWIRHGSSRWFRSGTLQHLLITPHSSAAASLNMIENRFIYFLKNVVTMATLLLGIGMQWFLSNMCNSYIGSPTLKMPSKWHNNKVHSL